MSQEKALCPFSRNAIHTRWLSSQAIKTFIFYLPLNIASAAFLIFSYLRARSSSVKTGEYTRTIALSLFIVLTSVYSILHISSRFVGIIFRGRLSLCPQSVILCPVFRDCDFILSASLKQPPHYCLIKINKRIKGKFC